MSDPTEPSIPTLPPEELASAYLDGELPDEARRSVEADPQLLAIVEAFAAARAAVATPLAGLGEHDRTDMVAKAMAALPEASVAATTSADTANADRTSADSGDAERAGTGAVVPLSPSRRTGSRPAQSRRMVHVAAGALAAVAAAGILALVVSRNDSGDSTAARDGETTIQAAASAEDAGAGSFEQGGDSSATTTGAAGASPAPETPAADRSTAAATGSVPSAGGESGAEALAALPDLGPLANRTALIAAARPFATAVPADSPVVCAGYAAPLAGATFRGTPAYLVVIEASAAGNRMALVGVDTCAVLVKVDLAES